MTSFLDIKDKSDPSEFRNSNCSLKEHICRLCFQLHQKSLQAIENPEKKLINMCLPHQLDINLVKDPVICSKCLKLCNEFTDLLIRFMNTEKKLQSYCSRVQNSPIKIDEFVENVLISDPDFSIAIIQEKESELSTNKLDLESALAGKNHNEQEVKNKLNQISINNLETLQVKRAACKENTEISVICNKQINQRINCNLCNASFKFKHSYNKHMNIIHRISGSLSSGDHFLCECRICFNRKKKAKIKKHHQIEKSFSCENCGKRFSQQEMLNAHGERVHVNEKEFSCEICNNKYSSKAGLTVHQKTRHIIKAKTKSEPDFVCDICGKLFCSKYGLDKHRMSHTGDRPFKCDQCEMRFKERYRLTMHMRTHTGEKPFECKICGFKFSWKNLLNVHMRKHTGARPFPCQFCKMAFFRKDHLIKHIRAIHTGERPFKCDICSKTFNRKDYLMKHKKVHLKHAEIIS